MIAQNVRVAEELKQDFISKKKKKKKRKKNQRQKNKGLTNNKHFNSGENTPIYLNIFY